MDFRKIGKVQYLLVLLAGILIVYSYFFSFLGLDYSPYYGDEYFFYKNSENFYLSNSLKATFTYSGKGSRLIGADAHGPLYPLLYGIIAKLVGWKGFTIPLINIGVLVLALMPLLYNNKTPWRTRLLQLLIIIGSPITLFYSVTYLPELLHIAGAIGLYLLMNRYSSTEKTKDFVLLLLFILLLGSIRSTWFFALFGLLVLPGPVKGFAKSLYFFLGLTLPFLYQHFLHEQVPNTFSDLGDMLATGAYFSAFHIVLDNFKQNICYAFTYADGNFYVVQKIWILTTVLLSITIFRKDKLICSGLVILGCIMLFNLILYKNYTWVDLRMYSPMTIFLNLGIIDSQRDRYPIITLLALNLISFILVLPLQSVLMNYRVPSRMEKIPQKTMIDLKGLDAPLVLIDTALLSNYKVIDLPILNTDRKPITYILPYYSMKHKEPSHFLVEEIDHLCVKSIKILNQKPSPRIACKK
ncbi:hypothetical protein [Algoriphagus resistens]|uniref:hypothetical protein n=1 Tax=Algoriphagus resistens TaxID=1750590 RepID=UPI0007168DBC|nr:hypothetical protein [Algoriphagus resistens]